MIFHGKPVPSKLQIAQGLVILFFTLLSADPAQAQPAFKQQIQNLPNPLKDSRSFVYDGAGLLGNRKADIDSLAKAMYEAGGAQIVVVTLESIGDASIEEFAVELFSHWGIGEKEKDNGILVLHVSGARQIRIEVGYGLEGVLPDAKASWITGDVAIPFFKDGDFTSGHYYLMQSLLRVLLNPRASRAQIVEIKETIEPGTRINPDQIPEQSYLSSTEERAERKKREEDKQSGPEWMSISLMAPGYIPGLWMLFGIIRRFGGLRDSDLDGKEKYDTIDDAILEYSGAPLLLNVGIIATEIGFVGSFWSAILLPLFVGGGWIWQESHLKKFRQAPRKCSRFNNKMRKLSEEDDDAYLEKGQVAEENAGTVDYDVWVCDCGNVRIERYKSPGSQEPCPSCNYYTYELSETRTVREPDYNSAGKGEKIYACSFCDYTRTEPFEIQRLKREDETVSGIATGLAGAAITAALYEVRHGSHSYSGSDSYSGSGSGGESFDIPDDFGGGESGGGGATDEY